MKIPILLCLLFIAVAYGDKIKKHKKYQSGRVSAPAAEGDDMFKMMEEDERSEDVEVPDEVIDNRALPIDPCSKVHCGAGRICQKGEDDEPECVCIPECPVETESRRKVCSNHNETWTSDCSVYQQRCFCDTKNPKCKGDKYKHIHIEYYGECRDMPECTKDQMADFPRRMRDWLFNIMRDLADRKELSPHFLEMEREAETNLTRRWTNAAIWKWCDLDGHPHDRSVSRHELFPIRAPLMSLEHCIAPFLNNCDKDNNHKITLEEWGNCLGLDQDELEDRCDQIINDD